MAILSQDDISTGSKFQTVPKRAGAENSRAQHRASLACVPCRSKHIKCDGYLPLCTRCKTEGKPCGYPNSRRGIRDPKKRNMVKDGSLMTDRDDITESTPSPSLTGFHIPTSQSTSHALRNPRHPFDLYYAYFHVAHSWLPPRKTLEHLWETSPGALRFLMATVLYIGSLYLTPDADNTSLRLWEKAYEMSQEPLPPTIWSVQALLSLSIAAFGQRHRAICEPMFIQARELALRLGLQHKQFADEQPGCILAESCRRTYWGLYIHEVLLNMRGGLVPSQLYPAVSYLGAELPCEEWEYQAGKIPVPVTLDEYDRLGSSREYSSWAYFIDLIRIYDKYMTLFHHVWVHVNPVTMKDANQQIDSWRFKLKNYRIDCVDDDGMVDMILYHALGVSYGLQVRIQTYHRDPVLCYELGKSFGNEHLSLYTASQSPYGVTTEPEVALPSILQAPLRLVSLFSSLIPEKLSPSLILDLERAGILLQHALFLNGGKREYTDRLTFLAEVLRKSGEFWPKSKAVSERIYATLNVSGHMEPTQSMAVNSETFMPSVPGDSLWLMPPTVGPIGVWSEPTSLSVRGVPMTTRVMPWPRTLSLGDEISVSGLTAETNGYLFEPQHRGSGAEDKSFGGFTRVKTESELL